MMATIRRYAGGVIGGMVGMALIYILKTAYEDHVMIKNLTAWAVQASNRLNALAPTPTPTPAPKAPEPAPEK